MARRRLPFFGLAVLVFGLSATALFFNPLIGAIGVVLFGFVLVNATLRLVLRRAYATELDAAGFRVFNAFGRLVHDVPWRDVERITVAAGPGWRGPGSVLHIAWRTWVSPSKHGRMPWERGGVNSLGEAYHGALPDAYLGIDAMLELFKVHLEAAAAHAAPPIEDRSDLNAF